MALSPKGGKIQKLNGKDSLRDDLSGLGFRSGFLFALEIEYDTLSHMLHVWNIYQHLPQKTPSFVGKYTIH